MSVQFSCLFIMLLLLLHISSCLSSLVLLSFLVQGSVLTSVLFLPLLLLILSSSLSPFAHTAVLFFFPFSSMSSLVPFLCLSCSPSVVAKALSTPFVVQRQTMDGGPPEPSYWPSDVASTSPAGGGEGRSLPPGEICLRDCLSFTHMIYLGDCTSLSG